MLKEILVIAIVPFVLTGSGLILLLNPPKDINSIYGFRTKLASRSKDTWRYANRKSAQLFVIFGFAALLGNLLLYVLLESDTGIVALIAYISIGLMLLTLLSVVFIVQYLLKRKFDEKGCLK